MFPGWNKLIVTVPLEPILYNSLLEFKLAALLFAKLTVTVRPELAVAITGILPTKLLKDTLPKGKGDREII